MSDPTVVAEALSYHIGGKPLVSDVSMTVLPSEFVGVIGPNGAGKSTLLRLLAGDLAPDSGSVQIMGAPVVGVAAKEVALRRAMVGANAPSDIPFTVHTVVMAGRNPHLGLDGNSDALDAQIVERAMQATGVETFADRSFHTLSTGEQARVMVARVLAQDSPVSLFDEPTASLDLANAESVLKTLRGAVDTGRSVMCAIHDLNAAALHCDRLVLLKSGEKVADGPPEEVLTEKILSDAYGHAVRVVAHPFRDCPLVLVS